MLLQNQWFSGEAAINFSTKNGMQACSVYRQFLTDVSWKPIGHILKGQEIQDRTDRFSRNVGKELPVYAA